MTKLVAGDQMPRFEALDQHEKNVESSAFNGRKLFVFFYPKANTSG